MTAGFDGHAHVFAPDLPFVTPRRYTPDYAASADALVGHLDRNGLSGALLTQPSFLGTDNSHMLAAVARYPQRLRAVVMVDPGVDEASLDALGRHGAIGIRLNLEGLALPDLCAGPWPALLERLRQRDWHVELHRRGADLPGLVGPALDAGVRVCVDHFGRPDPAAPLEDAGVRFLLSRAGSGRLWVKLSGAYRIGGPERGREVARLLAPRFAEAFGPGRLLWGSDWPHTQHETLVDYDGCLNEFRQWLPDDALRRGILEDGARQLFRLSPAVG